jgi:DNA-binding XRE family transcriptional regulator
MNSAARIRAFRKSGNLTQNDLAELWGVTVRSISRWERGEGRPAEWMRREMSKSVPMLAWPTAPALKAMVENYSRSALLCDSNLKVHAAQSNFFRWGAREGVDIIGADWHHHLSESVLGMLTDNGGFSSLVREGVMCIRGTYSDDPAGVVEGGYVDCSIVRIPDYGALCTVIVRERLPGESLTPLTPYFAD